MQPNIDPSHPRFDPYREVGHWDGTTLDARLVEHLARDPDRLAVIDRHGSLTYAQLADRVGRCAGLFRHLGVGAGDAVSVQLPNRREFVIAHLAAERLGAVTNPLLSQYREHELIDMQRKLRSTVAIHPERYHGHVYAPTWQRVREEVGFPLRTIAVHEDDGAWSELDAHEPLPARQPDGDVGDEVNIVLFTSGTVRAKGVLHTHNTTVYGLREYARLLELTPEMVLWMPSPISHATGLQWGVRTAIYVGGTLVLQERWDADAALDLVAATGATHSIGATAFVHDLIRAADARPDAIPTLRYFACAGAPIPEELAVAARERLGFQVLRAYGMSEHFISTICHPDDPEAKRLGTDGRVLPGTEIAVFDELREHQLPVGEVGELAVRGPGVALGYLEEPQITADTFRADGWQFSEDLAAVDADGFVRLLGRRKDLIIRGGLNVSAPEIEALLFDHPGVRDIALVGVPDDRLGERICAIVVTEPGHTVELDDLVMYLADRGVSKLKLPELIEHREALPKTPSGKIRKNVLREELRSRTP